MTGTGQTPFTAHPEGVVVTAWVSPGASRPAIGGIYRGALRVRVTAPPEQGRATTATARALGRATGIRRVELLDGAGSRRKRFLLRGAEMAEVVARLGTN
jgi:uncharacterized protein YggU (UPF0235/DUF167 family)